MEKKSVLASDPPPPYSELEFDRSSQTAGAGSSNQSDLENQVKISMREVEQAILRIAPKLELSQEQKAVIRRMTISLLKRNVREQNVLPTDLQRQCTLEHVILKFDKPSRNRTAAVAEVSMPEPHPVMESSAPAVDHFGSPTATTNIEHSQVNLTFTTTTTSSSSNVRNLTIIGQWGRYQKNNGPIQDIPAYDSHIPKALKCTTILLIIFFFVGTPLSLFFTVPALYWIVLVS